MLGSQFRLLLTLLLLWSASAAYSDAGYDLLAEGKLYKLPDISRLTLHEGIDLSQYPLAHDIDRNGGSYLIHTRLKNLDPAKQWVIDPHNSIISHVYLTLLSGNEHYSLSLGHGERHRYSLHYGQDVIIPEGEWVDVYVQFDGQYFSSEPKFYLVEQSSYLRKVLIENTWIFACLGAIIVLSLFNCMIGLWVKDSSYYYYSAYLLFSIIGWAGFFNALSEWFSIHEEVLIMVPFYFAIACNILYYIHFLDLQNTQKTLSKISYGICILALVLGLSVHLFSPFMYFAILSGLTAVWVFAALVCGVVRIREGYKPALFFIMAFSTVFVGAFVLILPNLGMQDFVGNADLFMLVAQTVDMLLLSLALAHRIKILKEEKEEVLLDMLQTQRLAFEREGEAKLTLQEANEKLEQLLDLSQLENHKKNEFLRLISHELRTPLYSIVSSFEQWAESIPKTKDSWQLRKSVSYGSSRLSKLIDNLVLIAESENSSLVYQPKAFNLSHMLENLEDYIDDLNLGQPIDLQLEKDSLPEYLYGDVYLFEHLLRLALELVVIYLDHASLHLSMFWSESEQQLDVFIGSDSFDLKESEFMEASRHFMMLSSRIESESSSLHFGEHVFSELLELLNASLRVNRSDSGRSIVEISVPMQSLSQQIEKHAQTIERILIVEDNPVNALLLKTMLEKLDYSVVAIHSYFELEEPDQFQDFDLIFMDIQMPDIDGIAATQRLREAGIAVPIIAVTAYSDSLVQSRCMDKGMNGFLVKPVKQADLVREFERLSIFGA